MIEGLAVAIEVIVTFAIYTKPAFTMSDEEIIDRTRLLPQVQAMYHRYPEPEPYENVNRIETTTYV